MLRPADMLFNFNSTRYSRDITFYVGKDKHGDLEANMAVGDVNSMAAVLRHGATTQRVAAAPEADRYAYSTAATLTVKLDSDAGGDAEPQECVESDIV
eukprot:3876738-Pleurochrysis_carterae.AAC.1